LGGKLTDCLNVGEEIVDEIQGFGHKVKKPTNWFGEGSQERREEFYQLVRSKASDNAAEIADGLWRRHGDKAFEMLGDTLTDLIPGLGVTEEEIRYIVANEQVHTREDLLRRRLPVSMARSESELAENQQLQQLLVELGL